MLIRNRTTISIEEIYGLVKEFLEEASPKRFEENIKFVFKLSFKRMKSNLQKKNKISFYSKNFDLQFFSFYFKDVVTQMNISIEEFFKKLDPKKSSKTLNNDFLKKVFSSPTFKEDFMAYINGTEIISDYQTTLRRKIRHMLIKFDRMFDINDPAEVKMGIEAVQKYFRKNRQCKLPWTFTEITTAINTFGFVVKSL